MPSQPTAKQTLNVPEVEGVQWDVRDTKWGSMVRPQRRQGPKEDDANMVYLPDFLYFSIARSSGTFEMINCVDSINISLKNLKWLDVRWPKTMEPTITPLTTFLSKRGNSQKVPLDKLFESPESSGGGWHRYLWQAYSPDSLHKKTTVSGGRHIMRTGS